LSAGDIQTGYGLISSIGQGLMINFFPEENGDKIEGIADGL
jgi:hypothetical protein